MKGKRISSQLYFPLLVFVSAAFLIHFAATCFFVYWEFNDVSDTAPPYIRAAIIPLLITIGSGYLFYSLFSMCSYVEDQQDCFLIKKGSVKELIPINEIKFFQAHGNLHSIFIQFVKANNLGENVVFLPEMTLKRNKKLTALQERLYEAHINSGNIT